MRAWAVLPASGAQEIGAAIACAGWDWASFFLEYRRGTAVSFQIEFSPYAIDQVGIENWFGMTLIQTNVFVPGTLASANVQKEVVDYVAQFGGTECWQYGPVHFARCYERFRILCGDRNTVPGYLKVTALFHTG